MKRASLSLRCLIFSLGLLAGLSSQAQTVPEAIGQVVFAAGQASIQPAGKGEPEPLGKGRAVHAGDRILTGADGHVHLRMLDQGFIGVRPGSHFVIQTYIYHPERPQENQVGLHLEAGTVRTISGKAGESARERYRFNTPIAAIGLRGTDYVVQAAVDATRINVLAGAVIVSPFDAACRRDSLSPCAGSLARELDARTPHAYLEVRAQGGAPALIMPDIDKQPLNKAIPPRSEEPFSQLQANTLSAQAANVKPEVSPVAPVVVPAALPSRPPAGSELAWGRWSSGIPVDAPEISALHTAGKEITFGTALIGLLRSSDPVRLPGSGQVGLGLSAGQAWVSTPGSQAVSPASLGNGMLQLDFASRQFSTQLTATLGSESTSIQAQGSIDRQGYLFGDAARSNAKVLGTLSSDARSAAYLFEKSLATGQTLSGAAYWR